MSQKANDHFPMETKSTHTHTHMPTPSTLPPCTPKATTCPWKALALSEYVHPLTKPTYSNVLQTHHPVINTNLTDAAIPPSPPCSSNGKKCIHYASDEGTGNGNHLHSITSIFLFLRHPYFPLPFPSYPTTSIQLSMATNLILNSTLFY